MGNRRIKLGMVVAGVAFVEACEKSPRRQGAWVKL